MALVHLVEKVGNLFSVRRWARDVLHDPYRDAGRGKRDCRPHRRSRTSFRGRPRIAGLRQRRRPVRQFCGKLGRFRTCGASLAYGRKDPGNALLPRFEGSGRALQRRRTRSALHWPRNRRLADKPNDAPARQKVRKSTRRVPPRGAGIASERTSRNPRFALSTRRTGSGP